jgi:hypothetical protein
VLRFRLDVTTNPGVAIPDEFSVSLLDRSGIGVPTQFFDVLVSIDIATPLQISTFASDASQSPPGCPTCAGLHIPAPIVTPFSVPAPGTLGLLASAIAGLSIARCRGQRLPRAHEFEPRAS